MEPMDWLSGPRAEKGERGSYVRTLALISKFRHKLVSAWHAGSIKYAHVYKCPYVRDPTQIASQEKKDEQLTPPYSRLKALPPYALMHSHAHADARHIQRERVSQERDMIIKLLLIASNDSGEEQQ
jgi:hypothetical protein